MSDKTERERKRAAKRRLKGKAPKKRKNLSNTTKKVIKMSDNASKLKKKNKPNSANAGGGSPDYTQKKKSKVTYSGDAKGTGGNLVVPKKNKRNQK